MTPWATEATENMYCLSIIPVDIMGIYRDPCCNYQWSVKIFVKIKMDQQMTS